MEELVVINMSGGLDSTTLAYRALNDGYTILPININYGQKNIIELEVFKTLMQDMSNKFGDKILPPEYIDLTVITKAIGDWVESRDDGTMEAETGFQFYTPSRNLLFTVLAAHLGESLAFKKGIKKIYLGIGIHKHETYDAGSYWDITPEFVNRLNHLFELNDCMQIEMYAPYADEPKSSIVKDALRTGVPYELTWTCYDPVVKPRLKDTSNGTVICTFNPCLKCEACIERAKAGADAGIQDINNYKKEAVISAEDFIQLKERLD